MNKLNRAFEKIKEIDPPAELGGLILQRINWEKSKRAKRKLFISYAGLIVSFAAVFPAIWEFGVDFFRSEFWTLLSLAFSDFMVVAGSRKEYLYSLGETLPIFNIVAVLIPIFGILIFLNLYFSIQGKIKNIHQRSFKLKLS